MPGENNYYEFMAELETTIENLYGKKKDGVSVDLFSMFYNPEKEKMEMRPMEFESDSNPLAKRNERGVDNDLRGAEMMRKVKAGQLFVISSKEPFLSQVQISPTTGKIVLVPMKENPIKIPENITDPGKRQEWEKIHDRFEKLVGGHKANNRWWRMNRIMKWRAKQVVKKMNGEMEKARKQEPVNEAANQEVVDVGEDMAEERTNQELGIEKEAEQSVGREQAEEVKPVEPERTEEMKPKMQSEERETLSPREENFRAHLRIMYHINKTNGAAAIQYGKAGLFQDEKALETTVQEMETEIAAEEKEFDDKVWNKVKTGDFKEAAAVVAGGLKHLSNAFDNSQVMDNNAIITGHMINDMVRAVREYPDAKALTELKNHPEYKQNRELYRGKARMAQIAEIGADARNAIEASAEKGEKYIDRKDLSHHMANILAADMMNAIKLSMLDGKPESMAKANEQIKELGKMPHAGRAINEVKKEFQKTNTFGELVKENDPKKVSRMLSNRVYMQRKAQEVSNEAVRNIEKSQKKNGKQARVQNERTKTNEAAGRKKDDTKVMARENRVRSQAVPSRGSI